MSQLLKDIYSPAFFKNFSLTLAEIIPSFNEKKFTQSIFKSDWENKELKQRMKHISGVLHEFLPSPYKKATLCIQKIIKGLQNKKNSESGFEFMFLPDYIETYGLDEYQSSVSAIEYITQFTSCEFAVRPFLIQYGEVMEKQMFQWSLHANHHVRRLSSEGIRPRLPWAMALNHYKKNPKPIVSILENLKNDPSEYVRRSVANNLNDISKDHPDLLISIAKKWKGNNKETDAIIKHASRTLLKQGHPEILSLYHLKPSHKIQVSELKLVKPFVKIGDSLGFTFSIHNADSKIYNLRIEYALYFLKQNGQLSKKIFKISERQINSKETILLQKNHSFKIITTRKYYPGIHKLSIVVNGQERDSQKFTLKN